MYEIAATVTTATPTELNVTGNWPANWLQAPGFRSIEIQRKLLTSESLGSPLVAVREEEILGNRANWPNLQLGDRVIVRCFFPGEITLGHCLALADVLQICHNDGFD